ncbi:hypothetical protein [Vibrio parahaemolyticus]|uniref:hypothetical protein n=1 Tax=Vibrio parahaemolyticus TaxID=670 RepID=UPI00226B3AB8|nr:hypothetical protein [Vibrio parahaemolyticus]MCX8941285.1 hypothetical protein [Vibrio parahaemolyticus]
MTDNLAPTITIETKGTTLNITKLVNDKNEVMALFVVADGIFTAAASIDNIELLRLVAECSTEQDTCFVRVNSHSLHVERDDLANIAMFLNLPVLEEC